MIDLVANKKNELKEICENHKVAELYLFGSAATDEFNEHKSDLDFAVKFSSSIDPVDFAENYFSFLDQLTDLFGKRIDLLSYSRIRNPVIKEAVENSKVQLYAA